MRTLAGVLRPRVTGWTMAALPRERPNCVSVTNRPNRSTVPGARPDVDSGFRLWLRSAAGRGLCERERPHIAQAVRRFHGESLLWVGPRCGLVSTTDRCMVRARFHAWSSSAGAPGGQAGGVSAVEADAARLPFPPNCFDSVVLHHALDVVADGRGALREVARVLPVGGRLLVVAFNPWSLWTVLRPWRPFRDMHPVSPPRLDDWLALLGFDCEDRIHLSYRGVLPFTLEHRRWRRLSGALNSMQLPFGGVYLTVATRTGFGVSRLQHVPAPATVPAAAARP